LRVRTLSTFFSSLAFLAVPATPALAVSTGGVAAGETPAASGGSTPKTATPAPPPHASPVTARTPKITYTGPVYEKTVTGEVVPYQPPTPAAVSRTP